MSFEAKLEIAGNKYNVINCRILLTQEMGSNGKPTSDVHAGRIGLVMEGTADDTFGSWMGERTKTQDGKIIFYAADELDKKFKEVSFEGAYLTHLIENLTTEKRTTELLLQEYEEIETDFEPNDSPDIVSIKFNLKNIFRTQLSTGISYCVLVRLSAAKITIDGVIHEV